MYAEADLVYSVVSGGDENTITEEYGFIGGGYRNSVDGAYGTSAGGYKNQCLSNYGTISGGFLNAVTGRFATVIGGARNYARGRFSLAAGYKADAKKEHSAAFGFSGSTCTASEENQIAFCADSVSCRQCLFVFMRSLVIFHIKVPFLYLMSSYSMNVNDRSSLSMDMNSWTCSTDVRCQRKNLVI